MKIPSIINKNFKLILRSKISALIILGGPLLIIMMVGMALNTDNSLRINIGYYVPSMNELTNSFIDVLKSDNYYIEQFKSAEECRDAISNSRIHICIIFPNDFEIRNYKVNEVVFLIDNSKMNLFQSVVDSIENTFNQRAVELSLGMTAELVEKLNETQVEITSKTSLFKSLKDGNKEMSNSVNAVAKNISTLDLTFNAQDFMISSLKDKNEDIDDNILEIRNIALDSIEAGENLIDELDALLDTMVLNESDEDEIRSQLNLTAEQLESLKRALNASYVDAQDQTKSLASLISNVQSNIVKVEEKFKKTSTARDRIISNTNALQKNLNDSLVKINTVEVSFNSILKNIQSTQITDVRSIVSPISKKIEPVVTEESQLNFYFPYLVVLIIMFIGILLASTLVIMEKTSNAQFRNLLTPTGDLVFILANFITSFIIVVIQVVIILLIFVFYFHKDLTANILPTSLILFSATALFIFVGMIIGNIFNTEETGTLASISVSSIFLFISGLIFPLERMPDYIRELAQNYNPFVFSTELLRQSMVLNVSIDFLAMSLAIFGAYVVICFMLTIIIHKFNKKQYLKRAAGYVKRRQLGKKYKTIEENRLLEISRSITEENAFKTKKGRATNLKELAELISSMDDEEFSGYINSSSGKNEFAVWVRDVLKNEEVADELMATKRRAKAISILKEGQKRYDSAAKRLKEQEEKSKRAADKEQEKSAKKDKRVDKSNDTAEKAEKRTEHKKETAVEKIQESKVENTKK
ncbi:MAG: ABC transporter permease [Candidatus Woesearchaeota archaeon]